MKIEVTKQPEAIGEMNLPMFRKRLMKGLELEKSFKDLIKIVKNETGMDEERVKHEMFHNINWGQVIKLIHVNNNEIIEIGLNKVKYSGMMQYRPDEAQVSAEDVVYTFNEDAEDGEEYMAIHSFIPLMEHHVDKFLQDNLFEYSKQVTWRKRFR